MLISWCIPCHKRHEDLAEALPVVVAAANHAPPVQIVVVDYSNPDPQQLAEMLVDCGLSKENQAILVPYEGEGYYHMAHGRNLSVRHATGDYIVISSTDITPTHVTFFADVRRRLHITNVPWLRAAHVNSLVGIIILARSEFLAAGGYDEQFEFYGGEDRDLNDRLVRRKVPYAHYPMDWFTVKRTENGRKVANYREKLTKSQMFARSNALRAENNEKGVLVANEGRNWGRLW